MEAERLRQVLTDLSDTLVSLQQQIEQANGLLANPTLFTDAPSSRSPTLSERRSPSVPQSPRTRQLEGRIEELETSECELAAHLERLIRQHGLCETEVADAIRGREGIMRQYRLLIRVTAQLLENVMQTFPPEEYDEELRGAVEGDLRRAGLRSPGAETPSPSRSSSISTARPKPGKTDRDFDRRAGESQAASRSTGASSTDSRNSSVSQLPAMSIHTGSRVPASVLNTAGPLAKEDFSQLGFDKNELDDLFGGLILPEDVCVRLAVAPRPPRGLGNAQLVFLYDPFYLETGAQTFILDWVTPQANRDIEDWLKNSDRGGDSPVFHTFTFSKKKEQWWYFGGLRWRATWLNVWPALSDSKSRATILKHLSRRSHGAVTPDEIEAQMINGKLQELCIEITSTDEVDVMKEVSRRLGRSLQPAKANRPIVLRGER